MNNRFKSVLLPTAYLPPLEYMVNFYRFKNGLIELHETWLRQSWRNRARIVSANGPLNLIIPVSRPHGNHTKTKDVLISQHENWQKQHWQSIKSAYGNAPFFIYYKDLFEPFYRNRPDTHLWVFNHKLLECIGKEINLPANLNFTTKYSKDPKEAYDLRQKITPKTHKSKDFRVKTWESYYQVFENRHGFISNLSIIDLLFHLGPESSSYLEAAVSQHPIYPREG